MAAQTIQIMIVEDEPVTRRGLQLFIQQLSGIEVAAIENNGEDAVKVATKQQIDLVLMDIGLPGISGIHAASEINKNCPSTRILMLTSNENPEAIFASFSAGADGYILKSTFASSLELAIRTVRYGSVWLDPQIAQSILDIALETAASRPNTIVLSKQELKQLQNVANASCTDGICLVEPTFVQNLKRFRHSKFA